VVKSLNSRTHRVIQTAIGSLLLGLITPLALTSQAHAGASITASITETVTVKDHTGAVLPGAIVEFGYGANSFFDAFTTPVVANSSGQAVVTLPSGFSSGNK